MYQMVSDKPKFTIFFSLVSYDKNEKELHTYSWFCFFSCLVDSIFGHHLFAGMHWIASGEEKLFGSKRSWLLDWGEEIFKKKYIFFDDIDQWVVCIFTNFHLTFTIFIQRVCWWNEVCKEEFQQLFRCKCPVYSYCRSPGRYYNAYCTMTNTGYIWTQPAWDWVPWSKLKSKHPNRVWTTRKMHIPK